MITARIIGANVRNADYQTQTAKRGDPDYRISRSDLVAISENAHKWRAGHSDEGSDATDWGSMVDAALSGQFANVYHVMPETYPAPSHHAQVKSGKIKEGDPLPWNANAKHCELYEIEVAASGRSPVKRKEATAVGDAVTVLRDDWDASVLLAGTESQVLIHGETVDRATGLTIPLRALLDFVPSKNNAAMLQFEGGMAFSASSAIADLKTAGDASKERWPRQCVDWGYHVQAALYLDLFEAATHEGRSTVLHLIQESKPPYEIGRRIISEQFLQLGRLFYRSAIVKYAQCLKDNRWPGYDEGWSLTEPDAWMVAKAMEGMGGDA